jgi:hypothetical protein
MCSIAPRGKCQDNISNWAMMWEDRREHDNFYPYKTEKILEDNELQKYCIYRCITQPSELEKSLPKLGASYT